MDEAKVRTDFTAQIHVHHPDIAVRFLALVEDANARHKAWLDSLPDDLERDEQYDYDTVAGNPPFVEAQESMCFNLNWCRVFEAVAGSPFCGYTFVVRNELVPNWKDRLIIHIVPNFFWHLRDDLPEMLIAFGIGEYKLSYPKNEKQVLDAVSWLILKDGERLFYNDEIPF